MLAAQLEARGWQPGKDGQPPDLVLVHTCTVTQRADRDSRRFILQAQKENPQTLVAVSGCLAEMEKETLRALPGVIAVIDQAKRDQAGELIEAALHQSAVVCESKGADKGFFMQASDEIHQNKSRAMIKIEDGCDGICTFCRVRLARGKPISRPLADILTEMRRLVEKGFQEIVITGVNIGCWQPGLAHLIPELLAVPGDFRIRLSSIEPQHLNDDLIHVLINADEKLCPHLHLPLQSGDNVILQAMGRTYTAEYFHHCIETLRCSRLDYVFTGDVIVGFPGESREAFENTCELIKQCNMVRLHVFPFSARPGTSAAALPDKILQREITDRAGELREIGKQLHADYCTGRIGSAVKVLLEQEKEPGVWVGTTETYDRAQMKLPGQAGLLAAGCITGFDGQEYHVSRGEAC